MRHDIQYYSIEVISILTLLLHCQSILSDLRILCQVVIILFYNLSYDWTTVFFPGAAKNVVKKSHYFFNGIQEKTETCSVVQHE